MNAATWRSPCREALFLLVAGITGGWVPLPAGECATLLRCFQLCPPCLCYLPLTRRRASPNAAACKRLLPSAVNQLNYCGKGSGGDMFTAAAVLYTLGASVARCSGLPCVKCACTWGWLAS